MMIWDVGLAAAYLAPFLETEPPCRVTGKTERNQVHSCLPTHVSLLSRENTALLTRASEEHTQVNLGIRNSQWCLRAHALLVRVLPGSWKGHFHKRLQGTG